MNDQRTTRLTDEQFERYLDLCRRMFERMRDEGSWPWADSPDCEDAVEFKDKPHHP
jgi:hypothetical protein